MAVTEQGAAARDEAAGRGAVRAMTAGDLRTPPAPPISWRGADAGFGSGRRTSLERGRETMARMTFASHPFLLGFDQLDRLVERTAKAGNDGYPPYNIEQLGENAYRITLAVAGFAEDDLAITVEDSQLVIRGRQAEDGAERVFLHRGIAARQFQKSFVLADGMEVEAASMANGLLHVDLVRSTPETVVQTVRITKA